MSPENRNFGHSGGGPRREGQGDSRSPTVDFDHNMDVSHEQEQIASFSVFSILGGNVGQGPSNPLTMPGMFSALGTQDAHTALTNNMSNTGYPGEGSSMLSGIDDPDRDQPEQPSSTYGERAQVPTNPDRQTQSATAYHDASRQPRQTPPLEEATINLLTDQMKYLTDGMHAIHELLQRNVQAFDSRGSGSSRDEANRSGGRSPLPSDEYDSPSDDNESIDDGVGINSVGHLYRQKKNRPRDLNNLNVRNYSNLSALLILTFE